MKKLICTSAIALTPLTLMSQAQKSPATEQPAEAEIIAIPESKATNAALVVEEIDPLDELTNKNALRAEKLKAELAEKKAEIAKLKLERELLSEQQQIAELKQAAIDRAALKKATDLEQKIKRDASIAKNKAALAEANLKLETTKLLHKTTIKQAELDIIEVDQKREIHANNKPIYLDNPLTDNNVLVISDRRIALNGPVTPMSADYICDRIHYFNNKNKKHPIFIVIDSSPGGSVMAGYRILKAMEGSDAPVHVVVKSFAASMAATIATLAEESYAYPNALILHHQLSSSYFFTTMNLTQQKEALADANKWWERLAAPIAKKMGLSTDELIKKMYDNNSDGDWVEFATEAKKLKWVNHIVSSIKETSTIINPDSIEKPKSEPGFLFESISKDGKQCIYLPRLSPYDGYFMHNPDGYYRMK